jgi:hypothetical protein
MQHRARRRMLTFDYDFTDSIFLPMYMVQLAIVFPHPYWLDLGEITVPSMYLLRGSL